MITVNSFVRSPGSYPDGSKRCWSRVNSVDSRTPVIRTDGIGDNETIYLKVTKTGREEDLENFKFIKQFHTARYTVYLNGV